jgi:hypothetical protein
MRIKQQKERGMNDTLRNDYMSKVGQGANLDKYVGPWTLGVDILPRWNHTNPLEEEINFYVLRSNCSELAVSVILIEFVNCIGLRDLCSHQHQ